MDPIIQKAYLAAQEGQSYAIATIIETTEKGTPRKSGSKLIVLADGSFFGTIGGGSYEKTAIVACRNAIQTGNPAIITLKSFGKRGQGICGGQFRVFIEPFAGERKLFICGAGHIALPLSVLAKMLNFEVTIIDERKDWANKKRFPHADLILQNHPARVLKETSLDQDSYIIVVTHSHQHDYACLKALMRKKPGYVGVIASRNKRQKFLKSLPKTRKTAEFLRSLNIPVGLDIGAQTPEEIAISIAAEIVATYNKKWLKSDKFMAKKKGVFS